MKKEDLIALGITDEVADKIFVLHGKDIETHKTKINDLTANQSSLATQLEEANKQIESFKGMDIESVRKSADDYKAQFEQAQKDNASQLASLKFDHALESALTNAKVKNAKAVSALLNKELLKLNDVDGSIVGLNEQIEAIKKDNDYLFVSDAPPPPKIITGGGNQPIVGDLQMDAMRKGAGLPTATK